MNNTTSSQNSTLPTSVGLTAIELWTQLLFFYLTIGGWASLFGNFYILYSMYKHRSEMNSRFFVIVASLSLTKGLLAFQTVVMTLYRIFRTLGYVSINQTRLNCLFIHFFMPPLFTVEVLVLIILVVDRALAIAAVHFYRTLSIKQIALICSVTIIIGSLIKLAMAFGMGDTPTSKVIACVNVGSPVSAQYQTYNANIDLVLVLLLLLSNICLIIDYRFRSAKAKHETAVNALKRQKKVVVTLRNVVLLHCSFTLTAKVLLTVATLFQGDTSIRLMAYGGMITQCDEFSGIIALTVSHPKLKQICCPAFLAHLIPGKVDNKVHPISTAWKV